MAEKQAIEGKRGTHFQIDPFSVKVPGIDYESGPEDPYYNPRIKGMYTANGEVVYNEGMLDSIMRLGVLEPILTGKKDNGDVVVVAGCSRILHAREACRRLQAAGHPPLLVPALSPLRGFTDAEMGEVMIAENELRQENSPLVKAELAALQLRRRGGDIKEAAKAFGMGEQTFRQLLSLREAAPEVKAAVVSGEISTSAGVELARLPRDKQPKALQKTKETGGTTEAARDARQEITGTQGRPSMATLRKLHKEMLNSPNDTMAGEEYDAGFVHALGWILGEISSENVVGLAKVLKDLK